MNGITPRHLALPQHLALQYLAHFRSAAFCFNVRFFVITQGGHEHETFWNTSM
ncbi:MAG TPA: hypothetical protein VGN31_22745 [Paraburkholderia sp.]